MRFTLQLAIAIVPFSLFCVSTAGANLGSGGGDGDESQCGSEGILYALGGTTGLFLMTTIILAVALAVVLCQRLNKRQHKTENAVLEDGLECKYWEDPAGIPTLEENMSSERYSGNVWFSTTSANTFHHHSDANAVDETNPQPPHQKKRRWYKPKRPAPPPPRKGKGRKKWTLKRSRGNQSSDYASPHARDYVNVPIGEGNPHLYKELDHSTVQPVGEYAKPVPMKRGSSLPTIPMYSTNTH